VFIFYIDLNLLLILKLNHFIVCLLMKHEAWRKRSNVLLTGFVMLLSVAQVDE
jgi:hypothetical protein